MFQYQLYPTKRQLKKLEAVLVECRWLYNETLAYRKSAFFAQVFAKAEEAGRIAVKVNPAYTSQDCSRCHHRQKMPLSERTYHCPCCLLSIDRDLNAALNIKAVGLHSVGLPLEAPAFMHGE
jgi:transposase